jgi:hypothetical protein
MFAELDALFASVPSDAGRDAYAAAIIEGNCLQKPTASTRRTSNQRLGELYSLDPKVALFRVLRRLWDVDPAGRPQLAMLVALARDPLFMASAQAVASLAPGIELQRAPVRDALRALVGERMNDAVLDKVARNVSSSWTQTGHLDGRAFKVRARVQARPSSVAFALYLGYVAGFPGADLLSTAWVGVLDCTPSSARGLAMEAKRLSVIDFKSAEDVEEFRFDRLDARLGSS